MSTGKKNATSKTRTDQKARGRAFFGAAAQGRARRQGFREWGGKSIPKKNLSLSVLPPPPPLAVVDVVVVAIPDAAVAIAAIVVQAHKSARPAAGAKRVPYEQQFGRCSKCLSPFPDAAPHCNPLRALRSSSSGRTIGLRYVKHTSRLFQPQGSNVALVSSSLIGVVDVCLHFLVLPLIATLRGPSAPHAVAGQ